MAVMLGPARSPCGVHDHGVDPARDARAEGANAPAIMLDLDRESHNGRVTSLDKAPNTQKFLRGWCGEQRRERWAERGGGDL